ncbi:hypothetical protein ON010_g7402 [Phytophthora cinnamomi]|nr:hypothetical protein ON010_g7402 [Phytophthora cinnamomi]
MLARPGIAAAAPHAAVVCNVWRHVFLAPRTQQVTEPRSADLALGASSCHAASRHQPPLLLHFQQRRATALRHAQCGDEPAGERCKPALHAAELDSGWVLMLWFAGFTVDQSEAILQVMKDAMADSLEAQSRILATKSEHVELKAELSERVFNSTLKFDIAQRHSRELLERDFNTLKQDIRMLEKIDFDKIRMEIAELEKKFLLQKQAEDETLNELRLSMEKVEKRMLQYAVGFAGTIMAVGAALLRLVL